MFHYFLEVSLAWTLMLIVYYAFLRKETFFKSNRLYLMYSLSLGMVLPLVRKLPFVFNSDVASSAPVEFINAGTYHFSHIVDNPAKLGFTWDYQSILLTIYAIGLVFFTFRMFYGLLKILQIWNTSKKVKKGDYTLVIMKNEQLPFSFFKNVFISESFLQREYIQKVLEHELVHIKHKHTYDVFAVQLLSIVFWCNPLIYIFKKALKETHEYLADAYACLDSDIKNYGLILLGQSSSGIELALTNQFFNSLLKKRINMLNRKKSAGYKMSKYLLAIPVLCFMVILFSASSISSSENVIENDTAINESIPPEELIEEIKQELVGVDLSIKYSLEGIDAINKIYNQTRRQHPVHKRIIQKTLVDFALTQKRSLSFTEKENDVHSLQFIDINYSNSFNNDDKLKSEMEKEFAELHSKCQVKGKGLEESKLFLKILKKYEEKYSSHSLLREDFTSIACSFGIKLIMFAEGSSIGGFKTFMYIVPKENFKAWRNGEMPAYDELVCGPNSVPPPPAPPTPPVLEKATELENSFSKPAVDIKSPPNDILFIGLKNTIKVKTINIISERLNYVISNGPEYFKVKNVFTDYDTNNFTVDIEAINETPISKPCAITFLFDDGNKITKEFHVRKQQSLPNEAISFKADNMMFHFEKDENTKPLTLHNGEEIELNENDVISLDGHIVQYDKEEAILKFGDKGKNGVLNLEGNIEIESSYNKAHVIIDDKVSTHEVLNSLNPDLIRTINIYKDEKAKEKYGEQGIYDVIEVFTKLDESEIAKENSSDEYLVSGRVFDEELKEPLIGANVIVDGTRIGTITDLNGNYKLSVPEGKRKIVASYVGYKTLDSEVSHKCDLTFGLEKNGVVVGVKNAVKKNEESKIEIRTDENDKIKPLCVIDGIRVDATFDDIDPNDIKEITVLKKKEDVEKYGPQGKNGVILITTKKGNFKPSGSIHPKEDKLPKPTPLLVVDGEIVTELELSDIDTEEVATMNVMKAKKAIEKYGDKGKNGVVEVFTKQKKENIIVLSVVNGVEKESNDVVKIDKLSRKYSLTSAVAMEKANIETNADQVDFIFTEANLDLEKQMPLSFKLLENPIVDGNLKFEYSVDELTNVKATVFNVVGKKIKTKNINPSNNKGNASIDLIGLSSGMYILVLQSNGSSVSEQFMIAN